MKKKLLLIAATVMMALSLQAQTPDPNFFIYLCFGQSNMEAGATPADQDKDWNDPRFQFVSAVDMPRYNRVKGEWYTATPPICRQSNNMGPVDFFGRKMIEELPSQYRVGVINVSVAGAKLELWDKDACEEYLAMEAADPSRNWLVNMAKEYDMNCYQRIVDMAKIAQKSGVIKGMLVHQGESNPDDDQWCARLKKIHDDLCADLGLNPDEIPLLAGELKQAEQGGVCAAFNEVVLANLPKVMKNGYVISSLGCESTGDQFHFSTEGMRLMGYRMAEKMLQLQGFKPVQERSVNLNLKKKGLGIEISPTLAGIFFEDINQSLDGGICAQLIQNHSFQAYNVPDAPVRDKEKEFSYSDTVFFGWTVIKKDGSVGEAHAVADKPLVKDLKRYYDFDPNDKYDDELRYAQYSVKFDIEDAGQGFGIAANGYGTAPNDRRGYYSNNTQKASIPAQQGVSYDLTLYLAGQSYPGTIKVCLEDANGQANSNVITISGLKNDWQKYTGQLKAERSVDSRLAIMADAAGTFWLDYVTLLPEASQLWQDGKFGPFRKDLMQALADLHPTFMRFPGGCASEGTNYFGQPFWKNSVGPEEERIGFRNHWGYWTSQYVGFYEYLLMAESLGATPLPVLNNGVTCQFAGHQYIAPLETEADRKRFHDIFVCDALDFIEFCNGGTDTKWGKLRADMGHPEPFNLKYLGIGNENKGPEFWERFDIIYKEVQAKYPDIIIVSTAGSAADGPEFNANMHEIDEKYQNTVVDEHYYRNNQWFYTNGDRYHADKVRGADGLTYDRNRPTRVFVGEFANNNSNNDYASAMAEAAYWTSLERNSDMVVMAAYAPLLCKKGYNKWNSNLIWFDNRGMWRTTNYYYQALFSEAGNRAFQMTDVMNGTEADATVYTSPTVDTETGEVYIKFVNSEAVDKELTINMGKGQKKKKYTATVDFISSHDTKIKNQGDLNSFAGAQPQAQQLQGGRPGPFGGFGGNRNRVSYTEAVVPHTKNYGTIQKQFQVTLPENSIGIIKLTPAK